VAVAVLQKLLAEAPHPDLSPNGGPPGSPRARRFPPHGLVDEVRI
jgi:hypothetical protein